MTFSEISNDSARVAALLSDRVDFINAVPSADVARLRKTTGYTVHDSAGIFIFFLFTDYRQPTPMVTGNDDKPLAENPFRNVKVRQAISYAVNREALATRVMEETATPSNQFLVKGFTGYVDALPPIPLDVDKAKALMAEAGYPNGFKTQLYCTSDRLPKGRRGLRGSCADAGAYRHHSKRQCDAARGLYSGAGGRHLQPDDERLQHANG